MSVVHFWANTRGNGNNFEICWERNCSLQYGPVVTLIKHKFPRYLLYKLWKTINGRQQWAGPCHSCCDFKIQISVGKVRFGKSVRTRTEPDRTWVRGSGSAFSKHRTEPQVREYKKPEPGIFFRCFGAF